MKLSSKKKIVYLTSRVPFPLEKGDKLRAYHQMKTLSKRYDIHLMVVSQKRISQEARVELEKFCKEVLVYRTSIWSTLMNLMVSWISGFPFQVGYFYNSGAALFIKQKIESLNPAHIFVQLVRMAEYVKHIEGIPKSLDYMDTFSMGMLRRKEKEQSIKKVFFSWEHQRLAKYEKLIFPEFDHHFIISLQDRDALDFEEKNQVKVIPNGVDDEYFSPDLSKEKKFDLLFTGNMSYAPNVGAVQSIVKEILPLIWEKYPQCNLLIAGANPSPAVKALEGDKVKVSGWMDDIRDAYNAGRICLAPLNIGTGLQNKLLEAMSMELPCITSALTNNALGAKNGSEIVIANSPQEFSDAVIDLIEHPEKQKKLGLAGKNFVKSTYNWEAISLQMEAEMNLL